MNARNVTTGILVAGSIIASLVMMMQQRRLASLRARRVQVATEVLQPGRQAGSIIAVEGAHKVSPPPPELLELRSKVTQLTQRRNELVAVQAENERLHIRLAARGTNNLAALPAGYFRPSQAQWVGTSKPDNTLQSFFWAVQQRNFTNLLELSTPHFASDVKLPNDSPEEYDKFMEELSTVLAIHIVGQRAVDPDTIRLDVEYLLRLPNSLSRDTDEKTMTFRRIDGQWKLD